MVKQITFKRLSMLLLAVVAIGLAAINMSGCSAGQKGLLTITPEQYFYSAKETLETIDERNYEERDLDEIIRILENAEKDGKKSDTIDKARMYLCLAYTLKARKQYQLCLMKGQYVTNRAAPFFVVDTKDVKETLRIAKKWLRSCDAHFKTTALQADMNFVRGLYYTQKMLTQQSNEKQESLNTAVLAFRRCLGMSPAYVADFKLFGRQQTPREVRLRMIEALALAGQTADAYAMLSEFSFAPISPVSGATDAQDFAWHHMQGFVLAMMGKYEEAARILEKFKIVAPQDYPQVDEALWILEGIYDKLAEDRREEKFKMEARIVAALLKKLKGPYEKEKYSTAAHLFPRQLPGDLHFFSGILKFYEGQFDEAYSIFTALSNRGIMSSGNRLACKLHEIEAMLYSERRVSDDLLEEFVQLTGNPSLTPLQKERAGFLLARYIMDEDNKIEQGRVNHSGQSFVKSICGKPWALDLNYRRGEIKRAKKPVKNRSLKEEEAEEDSSKREPGTLVAEIYANRPEDWVVSANLYLVVLPELSLPGKDRIVGREDSEGGGWVFKDTEIDKMLRKNRYLAIFAYDNSDSEKSLQGIIFQPKR